MLSNHTNTQQNSLKELFTIPHKQRRKLNILMLFYEVIILHDLGKCSQLWSSNSIGYSTV